MRVKNVPVGRARGALSSLIKLGFLTGLGAALMQTAFAEVGPWNYHTGSQTVGRLSGASAVTGGVSVSTSTEAIELTQGEPLLLTYRVSNGLLQSIGFEYRTAHSPLRLEVSRITDSPTGELAATWPPTPKEAPPRKLNLNGPLFFGVFPETRGRSLSPGTWFDDTIVIPLQDAAGKPLAAGRYQMEVFIDLPAEIETVVETGEDTGAGRRREILSSPGSTVRGKFRIALTVLPANPLVLNRAATRLRRLAAAGGTTDTRFYVETLLHFPAEIASAACRSLIYDDAVRGNRQRSNAIIESLSNAATPQSVDLLALMAWRLKDEEAKRALARLYREKWTAGDEETAARIADWFTKNHAPVTAL